MINVSDHAVLRYLERSEGIGGKFYFTQTAETRSNS